jgi:hypothetical protein
MGNDIINFFEVERQIFGICPKCKEFFRLSECKIFLKGEKPQDWMDKLNQEQEKIERQRDKIEEKREEIKAEANERGRKQAQRVIRSIDLVLSCNNSR